MKSRKKVAEFKEMIIRKGATKINKKMITVEGDKQDQEEGDRAQGVVSLGKNKLHKKGDELL